MNNIFTTNLKAVMDDRGIKQIDVARNCGISPALVYKYYHSISEPSVSKAIKICDYLGIDVVMMCNSKLVVGINIKEVLDDVSKSL